MKTLLTFVLIIMAFADQPRKVLLFYKSDGQQQWKKQLEVLETARKGLNERDIVITSIPFSDKNGSSQNSEQWKKFKVDTSAAFTFILVGRDGGEKLTSAEIVTVEKLFGLIDAMPMRQREAGKEK